jgi:hypothetical protein
MARRSFLLCSSVFEDCQQLDQSSKKHRVQKQELEVALLTNSKQIFGYFWLVQYAKNVDDKIEKLSKDLDRSSI